MAPSCHVEMRHGLGALAARTRRSSTSSEIRWVKVARYWATMWGRSRSWIASGCLTILKPEWVQLHKKRPIFSSRSAPGVGRVSSRPKSLSRIRGLERGGRTGMDARCFLVFGILALSGCMGAAGSASGAPAAEAAAMQSGNGSLEGSVSDQNFVAIPNAQLRLVGTALSQTASLNGHFRFDGLAPGVYKVAVVADGWAG